MRRAALASVAALAAAMGPALPSPALAVGLSAASGALAAEATVTRREA